MADLKEMLRLSNGAMLAPTVRAQSSGSFCETLAESYRALWNALVSDPDALEAVLQLSSVRKGSEWPPTFVQVQQAYAAIAHDSTKLRAFDSRALYNESDAAQFMVASLGNEVRRRSGTGRYGVGPSPGFVEALPTEWEPFVARYAGTSALNHCNRAQWYFILEADHENGIEVVLLAEKRPGGKLVETGDVIVPLGPFQFDISHPTAIHATNIDIRGEPNKKYLPKGTHTRMLMLFLAALPVQTDVSGTTLNPPPAGLAQIRQAMVYTNDYSNLPRNVQDYIARAQRTRWHYSPNGFVLLDACQLATALLLFQGQLYARAPEAEAEPFQQTLASMAAMAHQGEFPRGLLLPEAPEELRHRAAAHVWQNVCAAPASIPSGRLHGARRLLDVARAFDVPLTEAQLERPELLCSDLADYTEWAPVDESESETESEWEAMDDIM